MGLKNRINFATKYGEFQEDIDLPAVYLPNLADLG